ncbi:C-type lectin domain family 2 member B-like isoform X2 [Larus michahellis]|uniref:C-type lectin domain family 2 member B-like isoform X2 n=1 Tax=Larus michahellis TaxID=119627 RepID=UPI003D9B499E
MREKNGFCFNDGNVEEPLHPKDGGEKNGFCFNDGNVEEPLRAKDGGEKNGFCFNDGNVEEPLRAKDGGKSHHPEAPGDSGRRMHLRVLAGRRGGDPAVPAALVLACPDDWVGYRNVCYYLSRAEGSWEWSQEQCSSHGASLAMPRREGEMEFLWRLKDNVDYWLGLRRQGERLQWVNGSSFNQTFEVHGQGECAYLYDGAVASAGCSQSRPYICSKPKH